MSDKQLQFNFDVMIAPDFSDLDQLPNKITNKDQYIEEISKTKKELCQLGALINSSVEDIVKDENGDVTGVMIDTNPYDINNNTISNVVDGNDVDIEDDTYDKLLPPSNTAAFNQAIIDLNDQLDILAMISDLISNDKFIQDLLQDNEKFLDNCKDILDGLSTVFDATDNGAGKAINALVDKGISVGLRELVKIALDKFDPDKLLNQLIGDKISMMDQAIQKFTIMDQTGLTGAMTSNYNISMKSLTKNMFRKTYSNVKDLNYDTVSNAFKYQSIKQSINEGIDKIKSTQIMTSPFGALCDFGKKAWTKSQVGILFSSFGNIATTWNQDAVCYKAYLLAQAANYAIKNQVFDAVQLEALMMRIGKELASNLQNQVVKTTVDTANNNFINGEDTKFSDMLGTTTTFDKDMYEHIQALNNDVGYSNLLHYVDIMRKYAKNDYNTGLVSLGIYDQDGIPQIFEYLKNEIKTPDDLDSLTEQSDTIVNNITGENSQITATLEGETIDINKKLTFKDPAGNLVTVQDYLNSFNYTPQIPGSTGMVDDLASYEQNIINSSKDVANNSVVINNSSSITPNKIPAAIIEASGKTAAEIAATANGVLSNISSVSISSTTTKHLTTVNNNLTQINSAIDSVNNVINNDTLKGVLNDYKNVVNNSNLNVFNPDEEVIQYHIDKPEELSECIKLHIKYRTQKLYVLSKLNKFYYAN